MRIKSFLSMALAMIAGITMLTACGDDEPKPTEKPTSGYFTYYLVTSELTLKTLEISTTLECEGENKSGIVNAADCIRLDQVSDAVARASIRMGIRTFRDQQTLLVYPVKFSAHSTFPAVLTHGLHFTARTLDEDTPDPDLCYGYCITFTPNVGSTYCYSGIYQYTAGVRKNLINDYVNMANTINENKNQYYTPSSN